MKIDELWGHIKKHWNTISSKLLEGKYNPSPVRKVEIQKPESWVRVLGRSTVQDRLIQQAIDKYYLKYMNHHFQIIALDSHIV